MLLTVVYLFIVIACGAVAHACSKTHRASPTVVLHGFISCVKTQKKPPKQLFLANGHKPVESGQTLPAKGKVKGATDKLKRTWQTLAMRGNANNLPMGRAQPQLRLLCRASAVAASCLTALNINNQHCCKVFPVNRNYKLPVAHVVYARGNAA